AAGPPAGRAGAAGGPAGRGGPPGGGSGPPPGAPRLGNPRPLSPRRAVRVSPSLTARHSLLSCDRLLRYWAAPPDARRTAVVRGRTRRGPRYRQPVLARSPVASGLGGGRVPAMQKR